MVCVNLRFVLLVMCVRCVGILWFLDVMDCV